MNRFVAAAFLGGLGLGLIVGLFWPQGGPPAEQPVTEVPALSAHGSPVVPAKPQIPAPEPEMTSEQCKNTLALLRAAYDDAVDEDKQDEELIKFLGDLVEKAGASSPDGTQMEFPEGLSDTFRAEQFNAHLDELKKQCPKQFPDSATADCAEFPCVIRLTADESSGSWNSKECPQFNDIFGGGTSIYGHGHKGTNGENLHTMQIFPVPNDQQTRDFMKEYEGNLRKRQDVRFNEFLSNTAEERYGSQCDANDREACEALANALKRDEDRRLPALQKACDLGSGSSCNNLAWSRCHDQGICDEQALAAARKATESKPEDGKGAWDTLAYTLCQMGKIAESNAAYRSSCEAGYQKNCGKTCEPKR